jgi:hypothetical protein
MKCPHCTVSIHESWHINHVGTGPSNFIGWLTRYMKCPACEKYILQAKSPTAGEPWFLIHPKTSSRGPVPADVPPEIAEDYNQAALVLDDSPKASAALSRRCLQAILRRAGYQQKDLAKQIEAVLAEEDARKALPTGPHNTLDAVRNFGNFSAHPINDLTTLQVLDVEDHEAEYCLDILDALFDHYFVRPEEAKRRRAALDAKLANAGKPPSK